MVESKLKAKLRNENCENCSHSVDFNGPVQTIIVPPKAHVKKRVYCTRHRHYKKFDKWCKFYTAHENPNTTTPNKRFNGF